MDFENILQSAGFDLQPTETASWTAVMDRRPEFRKAFGTTRVGKIQARHFYVTVRSLNAAARDLMSNAGLNVVELKSSSGQSDAVYPGFRIDQCDTPDAFVSALRELVERNLPTSGSK